MSVDEVTQKGRSKMSGNGLARVIIGSLSILFLLGIYSRHFDNSFHFDDSHTIEGNVAINSPGNIPSYFVDATKFSSLPANRMYRPLTTTSLAIDYWLGGGLNPLMFHISTFFWFTVQLITMWVLCYRLLSSFPEPSRGTISFFAVFFYGVHPVCAETINYIIQRGDLYSTLGVVGGVVTYICWPASRSKLLYLVPPLLGCLSKQAAIVFAPIFWIYLIAFESKHENNLKGLIAAAIKTFSSTIPAWVLCIGFYFLQAYMAPPSSSFGGGSRYDYAITQAYVILTYFTRFFVPVNLTADTDWQLMNSALSLEFALGITFIVGALGLAVKFLISQNFRAAGFGLFWFFIALAPTSSFIPFAEVMNDHRMFFPFVGLTIAAANIGAYFFDASKSKKTLQSIGGAILTTYLVLFSWQTWERNEVWHSEESLWLDTIKKSPKNGRALMNYGLTQMNKGDFVSARNNFKAAEALMPYYVTLAINLGVVESALGNKEEGERQFKRAITLNGENDRSHFFYARWLYSQGRIDEAIERCRNALRINPTYIEPNELLLRLLQEDGQVNEAKTLATQILQLSADSAIAKRVVAIGESDPDKFRATSNSASYLIERSMLFYTLKDYKRCAETSRSAAILAPTSARAYNNLGACYNAMEQWKLGAEACLKAIQLDPNLQIAKNNLKAAEEKLLQQKNGTH